MTRVITAVLFATVMTTAVSAQTAPSSSASSSAALVESMKFPYEGVKGYLTAAAAAIPENLYGYRPTPDVRTFAELFGHIADANYMFCSASSGAAQPGASVEKTMKTKADIQKALAESFASCDRAFAGLNDTTAAAEATIAPINNMKTTKLGALAFNTAHDFEHYGNIITYMRLNKMTPPSSQPQGGQ